MSNSEIFLNDWQAGFRPGRGCHDNITILRTVCERFIQLGECLAVTFIDYAAAFDSLSHKYIDRVLTEANVPNKELAMFRAICSYRTHQPSQRYKTQMAKKLHLKSSPSDEVSCKATSHPHCSLSWRSSSFWEHMTIGRTKESPWPAPWSWSTHWVMYYADDTALVDLDDETDINRATGQRGCHV